MIRVVGEVVVVLVLGGKIASNNCRLTTDSQQHSSMYTSSFFCRIRHVGGIHSASIGARFLVLAILLMRPYV